jgi:hypothetical protein
MIFFGEKSAALRIRNGPAERKKSPPAIRPAVMGVETTKRAAGRISPKWFDRYN